MTRTLPRRTRAFRQQSSSWVYPPRWGRELRDMRTELDALTAAGGVDPAQVADVADRLAALRAQVDTVAGEVADTAATVETATSSLRTDLTAALTAEAQARVGGDQNVMGVANQARSMARDARDTTATLSGAVADDRAAMPATVAQMIDEATGRVVSGVLADAEHVHHALADRIDALEQNVAGLTTRLGAEEQARGTLASALVARLSVLDSTLAALTARVDAATARLDTLAARRTMLAGGAALLPALAVNTPKDVDVPWEATLPAAPHSARVAGVDGITALLAATVKQTTTTKAVVTVTSPALLAVNVARLRVQGVYEGVS